MTPDAQGADAPRPSDKLILGAIPLVLNLAIFILILAGRPEYLRDFKTTGSPDAMHYVALGENLWLRGVYSRQDAHPYTPDILRTPVYPVVAGGVETLFGVVWPLYALQAALSIATVLLAYRIGLTLGGVRVARIAGAGLALSLMMATLNFEPMSEPLFAFLSTLATALWLPLLSPEGDARAPLRRHALVGVVVGLATLTRPTGLYLAAILAVFEAAVLLRRRASLARVAGPVVLVAAAACIVAPWIARNHVVHGVPRLTTADTINLLYFAGAGAYQVELGIDREQAQERIAGEYGVETLVRTNNFWTSSEDVATMNAKQRAAAKRVLMRYPLSLLRATATGIAKSFLGHNTDLLANATGATWHRPGLGNLAAGRLRDFAVSLRANRAILVIAFIWQTAFALLIIALAPIGIAAALRSPGSRVAALALLLVAAYYTATIAVVGIDAYARHRSMIEPISCVFAGFGIERLVRYARDRRPKLAVSSS